MFDFSKLADMSRLASEAKQVHERQEQFQREQIELLRKISRQIDEAIALLKTRS